MQATVNAMMKNSFSYTLSHTITLAFNVLISTFESKLNPSSLYKFVYYINYKFWNASNMCLLEWKYGCRGEKSID